MSRRVQMSLRARTVQASLAAAAVAAGTVMVVSSASGPALATANDACSGPNTVPTTSSSSTSSTSSSSTSSSSTSSSSTSSSSSSTSSTLAATGVNAQEDSTTSSTVAPLPHVTGALVTGALAPGGPHVRVFKASDRQIQREFFAYASGFKGGVNVALGDVNNDNYTDIITGAGPGGGSHVKVFSGKTQDVLSSFFAFAPGFDGGINVASCDVNNDGNADIVVAPAGKGGPHVKVYSGAAAIGTGFAGQDSGLLASWFAYAGNFLGGVRVASADADGDGKADIITGAGPGGSSHVRVLKIGATPTAAPIDLGGWFAYPGFGGGVFVGANTQGNTTRIITGAGPGGGQHVKLYQVNGQEIAGVIPQGGNIGATVAIGNADADADDEWVVGHASGAPLFRLHELPTTLIPPVAEAYGPFGGGISVALGDI